MRNRLLVAALALGGAFGSTLPAQGQAPVTLTAGIGTASYHLIGRGNAVILSASLAYEPSPILVIEPTLTALRYRPPPPPGGGMFGSPDSDPHITAWFPEIGVTVQPRLSVIRPYLGGGFGFSSAGDDLTLHDRAGLRIWMTTHWLLQGDIRWRRISPFDTNRFVNKDTRDLTLAIGRKL